MDFATLLRTIWWRKWFVLPVLIATGALAAMAWTSIEPTYQATASALVIGPSATDTGEEANGFIADRGLAQTALAVSLVMGDPSVRSELTSLGFTGKFTVSPVTDTPILNLTVTAEQPGDSVETLDAVIDYLNVRLEQEQEGAPESRLVSIRVLAQSDGAKARYGSRDRAVAVIVGLGVVMATIAAVVIDALLNRRGSKRESSGRETAPVAVRRDPYPGPSSVASADWVTVTMSPQGRTGEGLLALYRFDQEAGDVVNDISGVGAALDLVIEDPTAVKWADNALTLLNETRLTSLAATKISDAVAATDEFTIEAWVTPSNAEPVGPGRIVAFSLEQQRRNVVLGQGYWVGSATDTFEARLSTSDDANHSISSAAVKASSGLTHLVLTRTSDGHLSLYVDGTRVARRLAMGSLDAWDRAYPLVLGNDGAGDRGWLGTYHLVAIYDRACTDREVEANWRLGHVE